ncbi:MAG TPA: hypothetical protein VKA74_16735, partial [Myxococcota bacterium]|nr:hypothetical protein [Myxococcota bacterium]
CGEISSAEDLATSALALTDEETDPLLEADVGFILGSACHTLLRPEEGLEAWQRGAAAARAAGDRSAEARCLQRVAMSHFCFGRIEAFEREREHLDASEALYYSPGDAALAWSIELELAALRGDWAATERHGARVRELVARSKNPWSQLAGAYALACARATQGDGARAREALDTTRDPSMPFAASNRSDVLGPVSRWLADLFVGEPVGLSPSDRDAWIERIESADETSFALTCACFGVEMADRTRDTTLATAALPIMTTADARSWVLTVGWPFFVPRLLGVAATLVGDWFLADGTFERATACAARLGFPIELGRTRLDHAQMLVLRNGDGDRDRARHLARLARSDLSLCPRNVFAGRVEKLCDYLQVTDAPADPAPTRRRIADERLPGG